MPSSSQSPRVGRLKGGKTQKPGRILKAAAEPFPTDFPAYFRRNLPSHFDTGLFLLLSIHLRGKNSLQIAKMVKTEPSLPSPPAESGAVVPLDSPIRDTPIHPDLPEVQLPGKPLPIYHYHPLTCQPIEDKDVREEIEQLRQEFPTKETALRAQEIAVKEAKRKIEDTEKKKEQVQKAIDKKIKERDTEMKVLSKFQEVKASDIPS
ncbi:hypothetical protein PENSTE_c001G05675 [Penicillium steckii]|uniref:Uncharacterized protein n=1 Tax=Penicillium steckii TaxID=303698 RepID=A0A1V6U055_9EURO|nr:hypothetical protein PENSTE_c001G05675 [Penicillium steckii]